jgi:hypothetical protein
MSASGSDSSVELSDDEYAALLASGPLVVIKQDVLDAVDEEKFPDNAVEEEMDTAAAVETVEITAMVCTTVPVLFYFP